MSKTYQPTYLDPTDTDLLPRVGSIVKVEPCIYNEADDRLWCLAVFEDNYKIECLLTDIQN